MEDDRGLEVDVGENALGCERFRQFFFDRLSDAVQTPIPLRSGKLSGSFLQYRYPRVGLVVQPVTEDWDEPAL